MTATPVQWMDVTGWTTLWAPEDGAAIEAAVLAQVQDGYAKGGILYGSNYSFTLPELAAVMGEWGAANPANRYLFDWSEYETLNDRNAVTTATKGLRPDQWAVGTAPDGRDILHSKILAILYPDGSGWTFSGSFNLSTSAAREANICDLIWSRSRAEAFSVEIQKNLSWCLANQQPQPPISSPPGAW